MRLVGSQFADGKISHDEARKEVVSLIAEHFNASRVSYWGLDGKSGERVATCVVSGGVPTALHQPGVQLSEADLPQYFETLTRLRVYACDDTATEKVLLPLKPFALEQGMPGALLHAACAANGRFIGVLCIEQVGGARRWTRPEIMAAMRIATDLSMYIARVTARAAMAGS